MTLETLPKVSQENPEQALKEAIELIFKHMVSFDKEPNKFWNNPGLGKNITSLLPYFNVRKLFRRL